MTISILLAVENELILSFPNEVVTTSEATSVVAAGKVSVKYTHS